MIELTGIGAAPGVAIGPAVVHTLEVPPLPDETAASPVEEHARLESALQAMTARLERLGQLAAASADAGAAEIFEAHAMFLEDDEFAGAARRRLDARGTPAEQAVAKTVEELAAEFEELGDEYFAQRAMDIRDIGAQLIRILLGMEVGGLEAIDRPSIVVAEDLTPSETVTIPPGMALGFCTVLGSPTSHTAILARSMGIPAVVGVGSAEIESGATLAIDGGAGKVWVEPDEETTTRIRSTMEDQLRLREAAQAKADQAASSLDGVTVEVGANVGGGADALRAVAAGAEGVGLFRTEFLFIDRGEAPSEEEQTEAYREVFAAMGSRPVVVRTLDVGGDKDVPGIELGIELNPFLGKRGLRLTLAEPALFRTQLRAVLRAAVGANLKLMFPMVTSVAEIQAAREAVREASESLRAEGSEAAADFEIGIMIEVPAAAVTADVLAPHVDFFSIGTNDLTQYTLAADRTNPAVAPMADAFHPAVLRLVDLVIRAGHDAGKWVGMCGELAGDPLAAPVLLGLGLDEWSMNPPAIPLVKERIRSLSAEACRPIAQACLEADSARAVREILKTV
ncbi:MAG: phosphoenolpyruvate--protein phosphotransferase [Acidimicrobiia bacterium]